MDTVSLTENQSAVQQRAAEDFQRRVLRAGVSVQREDGVILSPGGTYVTDADAQPTRQPNLRIVPPQEVDAVDERIIIDLDIPEVDDRVITLRSKQGETTIEVPAPRMENAFMIGRYQHLVEKTFKKMRETVDDRQAEQLNKQIIAYQKKLVRLIVPSLSAEQVETFNLRSLNEIVTVAEGMVQESMSATASPIAYVRRIYRLMGEEYGSNDRGMIKWLQEHFADIEAAFAEQDSPNE